MKKSMVMASLASLTVKAVTLKTSSQTEAKTGSGIVDEKRQYRANLETDDFLMSGRT